MKSLFAAIVVSAATMALTEAARAIPQLYISDGVTSLTIADGGPDDLNSAAGAVTWTGTLGVWGVNSVTGITKPAFGSHDSPRMNLSFANLAASAGTLTIMFTETGFTSPRGGWTNQIIAGQTAGTITYDIYGAFGGPTGNTPFALATHLGTLGPFTGIFSAEDAKTYLQTSVPFSLTQVIAITHDAPGLTSGSATLRVPDEGASILLFGAALAGLALLWRRNGGELLSV